MTVTVDVAIILVLSAISAVAFTLGYMFGKFFGYRQTILDIVDWYKSYKNEANVDLPDNKVVYLHRVDDKIN